MYRFFYDCNLYLCLNTVVWVPKLETFVQIRNTCLSFTSSAQLANTYTITFSRLRGSKQGKKRTMYSLDDMYVCEEDRINEFYIISPANRVQSHWTAGLWECECVDRETPSHPSMQGDNEKDSSPLSISNSNISWEMCMDKLSVDQ